MFLFLFWVTLCFKMHTHLQMVKITFQRRVATFYCVRRTTSEYGGCSTTYDRRVRWLRMTTLLRTTQEYSGWSIMYGIRVCCPLVYVRHQSMVLALLSTTDIEVAFPINPTFMTSPPDRRNSCESRVRKELELSAYSLQMSASKRNDY